MSKIYFIRHGQASLGKKNYDELSELGCRQSFILGQHFSSIGLYPDIIIRGDLQRHQQTSDELIKGLKTSLRKKASPETIVEPNWNEFDFESVIKAFLHRNETRPTPSSAKEFFSLLKGALHAWASHELGDNLPESWAEFEQRTQAALATTYEHLDKKTIFVISSGGTISMALKQLLKFDSEGVIKLNLQSRNTGVSEAFIKKDSQYVCSINGVPHLENEKYCSLITSA